MALVQVQVVQVQVLGRVNTSCIIYLLHIYLSCALAVQTRCLRKFCCCVCCLCYSRVISYPRFPLPRRNPKLCNPNPNPKHDNYMYDLDANRSDGAVKRNK